MAQNTKNSMSMWIGVRKKSVPKFDNVENNANEKGERKRE